MTYAYQGLKENGTWEQFESDTKIETPEQIEETGYSEVEEINEDSLMD